MRILHSAVVNVEFVDVEGRNILNCIKVVTQRLTHAFADKSLRQKQAVMDQVSKGRERFLERGFAVGLEDLLSLELCIWWSLLEVSLCVDKELGLLCCIVQEVIYGLILVLFLLDHPK